jgi:multisubunit Na+/H+ antiporter MnhB subunit
MAPEVFASVAVNGVVAWFWGSGLWHKRIGDCVAAMIVLLVWLLLGLLMRFGHPLNDLGFAAMCLGVLNLILSVVAPGRLLLSKRDLQAISALMLIGGFFLTLILM